MRPLHMMLFILILAGCSEAPADENPPPDSVSQEAAEENIVDDENEMNTGTSENEESEESEESVPSTIPSEPVEILTDERDGILPERIEIPAIDVDAPVQHLGLLDNGEMAVPDSLDETSWFEPGYEVGERGSSVIAGHVDDTVNPGVFSNLHTLEEGDDIIIHGQDGTSLTFTVYDKTLFDAEAAPVEEIFGYSNRSLLNLITCEGPYDYDVGGTPNRWVVYTELNTEA